MKKIAAVCAFPSSLNPGMLSVDMSLDSVFAQWGPAVSISKFCAEGGFDVSSASGQSVYTHLTHAGQLEAYDSVIFWGDFLHWIGYGKRDFLIRQKRRSPDRTDEEIVDSWYRLLMLEHREDLQKKAIIFGGTLYGMGTELFSDGRYGDALKALHRNAKLTQMRDVLSANFIDQITPHDRPTYGCDCAMLLDTSGWRKSEVEGGKYILCSFGRSGAPWLLQGFANLVARAAGMKLVTMNWLDKSGFPGLEKKISWIRSAQFVLTDTYHLAVSSLREGTPAICIGRGATAADTTLSDKKKELFFQQCFLAASYVYLEQITESARMESAATKLAQTVIDMALDRSTCLSAVALLKHQAQTAAARLRMAVFSDSDRPA